MKAAPRIVDEKPYSVDQQIGFLLRLAYQRASANLLAKLGPEGLTTVQWSALARLREYGALSQNDLGRRIGMEKGNIHGLVQRLVERGLVERAPGEDGRRYHLSLTGPGQALVDRLVPAARDSNRTTLSGLTRQEQDRLHDLLSRLIQDG